MKVKSSLDFFTGSVKISLLAILVAACADSSKVEDMDRPEPGKQGQTLGEESPGSVLPQPYQEGVNVIGRSSVGDRDTNIQLAWVDSCAYISTSTPNFLGWGVTAAEETYGVAVVDVSDPSEPKTVTYLRDKGSMYASEAMHAVEAPTRSVLAAGTYENGVKESYQRWVSLYDVSTCAAPVLKSEYRFPTKIHSLTVSPDGMYVFATTLNPFTGEGGVHVLDIKDLASPNYLGLFGATRPDATTFDFGPHELSVSADGRRLYAGVIASKGGDLNKGIKTFPPNAEALGPHAGGVYVLDISDIVDRKPEPKMRLVSAIPHGGWHSVMKAEFNGEPHLVGGGELGVCPGAWPKIINLADETKPKLVGEFKLEMNLKENCPPPSPMEKATGLIVGDPGTASLHFNDVDSETDTRLGLFNFMWAGLRIVDMTNPLEGKEIAYFKPGDACGGHVRYVHENHHIWLTCAKSGFYVLELKPALRKSLGL